MEHYLSVEEYDAAEERALVATPNRIIECCRPVVFAGAGYPMRVSTTAAAGRYLDVMQELRTEQTFDLFLGGGITPEEFELLESIARNVARMTEQQYGRRMVPRSSLLRAVTVFRHIRAAVPDPDAIILDIGSGSGYLGALLLGTGYRYVCTDITQGFYLYQNHLFNAVTGGNLIELATDPRGFFDLEEIPRNGAVHVPWWKFVVTAPTVRLAVDLVTCNHALCEMHPLARRYTIMLAHRLLAGDRFRPFLFEGWGWSAETQVWQVLKTFVTTGFALLHHDTWISVMGRRETVSGMPTLDIPRPSAATEAAAYELATFVDPGSTLSSALLASREKTIATATRILPEYDAMLRAVLGRDDLASDDERFLESIGGW